MSDLWLEDLAVGQSVTVTRGISLDDLDMFARLSGDVSPIHVDDDFATERGFDGRVAHGLLLSSHISGVIGTLLPGRNGVLQKFEIGFRHPIVPPDTIEISVEVTRISEATGQVSLKSEVRGGDGQLSASGKAHSIVGKRP